MPACFVESPGGESKEGSSFVNSGEAEAVVQVVRHLLRPGHHSASNLNVITFYNAQRALIQAKLEAAGCTGVAVISVDAMQGREVDVVILSAVRTGGPGGGGLGFLADPRRINVAVSRAKECLVLLGHRETLSSNRDWRSLLGLYRGWEGIKEWKDSYDQALPDGVERLSPVMAAQGEEDEGGAIGIEGLQLADDAAATEQRPAAAKRVLSAAEEVDLPRHREEMKARKKLHQVLTLQGSEEPLEANQKAKLATMEETFRQLVTCLARDPKLGSITQAYLRVMEGCGDASLALKHTVAAASTMAPHCQTHEAQLELLGAMAGYVELRPMDLSPSFLLMAKGLYDEEVLAEEAIMAWYSKTKISGGPFLQGLVEQLGPFVKWLRTAEEEESDEEEDEEESLSDARA